MRSYPKAFNRYRHAVRLLGLAVLTAALVYGGSRPEKPAELAVFFLLIFFAELLPIRFPGTRSDVTMTMPAVVSLFLVRGPVTMIGISSISIFAAIILIHRRQYRLGLLLDLASYHIAIYVISVSIASLAYALAGGAVLSEGVSTVPGLLLAHCYLWVFLCTTVNAMVDAIGASLLSGGEPWRVIFVQHMRWTVPNHLVTAPSGILFAYLYQSYDIYGILLTIIPFLVGRQALNQYATELGTYRETITTLGSYMQHYHPYTKGHLERVSDLADKVAKQMRLPTPSLMLIRDAGILHDIGKVGVSEEILDKAGQLTDEEWSTIKQHPARGAEILSQMKYLERIVPWVRGHHERPDGRGYPDGLKDGEISIEAACIAVADAFDAMTGGPEKNDQRVYRTPLTTDQALNQVRYGIGTQFDPRVVKSFLQVMSREEEGSG